MVNAAPVLDRIQRNALGYGRARRLEYLGIRLREGLDILEKAGHGARLRSQRYPEDTGDLANQFSHFISAGISHDHKVMEVQGSDNRRACARV